MENRREELMEELGETMMVQIWQGQKFSAYSMERYGMTLPQLMALFVLQQHEGHATMQELATATNQSGGTLTGIVDRLLSMGLVTREHRPEDRRVVSVLLTPAGYERLEELHRERVADFLRITADFSESELETLDRLMRKLVVGFENALDTFTTPAKSR